jgi:hypothetical protein
MMKLVIELTNGVRDAVGDCECVARMITGEERFDIEQELNHKTPIYYFEIEKGSE